MAEENEQKQMEKRRKDELSRLLKIVRRINKSKDNRDVKAVLKLDPLLGRELRKFRTTQELYFKCDIPKAVRSSCGSELQELDRYLKDTRTWLEDTVCPYEEEESESDNKSDSEGESEGESEKVDIIALSRSCENDETSKAPPKHVPEETTTVMNTQPSPEPLPIDLGDGPTKVVPETKNATVRTPPPTLKPVCACCAMSHQTWRCNRFTQMRYEGRRNETRKKGLCDNCLGRGHVSRDCPKPTLCRVTDCRVRFRHNTLLHPPRQHTPRIQDKCHQRFVRTENLRRLRLRNPTTTPHQNPVEACRSGAGDALQMLQADTEKLNRCDEESPPNIKQ